MSAIQVLEIKKLNGDGNLKAFAKVRVGALVIHSCRVIQQPNQRAWVSLPQTPGRAKADGASSWFPVVEVTSKDLMARISAAVLGAWEAER